MLIFFQNLHPVFQALLAGCFTWGMTALGAASIFTAKKINRKFLDAMLGFAAGVMIAASFWSLLGPAVEMSRNKILPLWFPAAVGFLAGVLAVAGIDKILPHLHFDHPANKAEGIKTKWRRSILLLLAVTLHNFPEGLAIGVVFGAIAAGTSAVTLPAALVLVVGLGLQNIPEGMAISFPLFQEGVSRKKSFWMGQLSAVVEPIGALLGAGAIVFFHPILPYALSFAAGAMMFVVVEELIPESQRGDHPDLATMGTMFGFIIMMILDVAFS